MNTLKKIYESSLKLLSPLTSEETFRIIVEEAVKLINGDEGSILFAEKGKLRVVYGSTPHAASIKVRSKGYTYQTFRSGKTMVVGGKGIHEDVLKMGIKSVILIPLSYRKKSIGVLSIRSYKKLNFSGKEQNVLKLFGSMASLAIRKTQLYAETKKALETRDLFISLASHELRTPLTSVSGYIQLLYNKLHNQNTIESKWVQYLYWESIRLTNLLDELLKLNQIKTGKLRFTFNECKLRDVVDRALTNLQFTHSESKISFDDQLKNQSDIVIGDFDKLVQVVTNLVDNAVKFSPVEKGIDLSLKPEGKYIVLEIKDYGVGISKSDRLRIFEGFYKGRNNNKEGMGLGLFLTKSIIDKHRGLIKVFSEVNEGTRVEVKLPRIKL